MSFNEVDKFSAFLKKKKVTILITDSGLGGISICAELAEELRCLHCFEKVSLIYFNAWPEQDRGYNRLGSTAERIQVFDNALEGMMQFKPDFIMIACNTLSVLYARTSFSRHVDIPVVDIVGFGVDMIFSALKVSTQNRVVILGTVTTIDSHAHRDLLLQRGIQPGQVISQPCDQLATEIEKGPGSPAVSQMISGFMRQAAGNIDPDTGSLYAALCCTHFGYCQEMIRDTLTVMAEKPVTILNPNIQMAGFLLTACTQGRFSDTDMAIQVVSRIIWDEGKINSISSLIQPISAETAHALKNYTQDPDLFEPKQRVHSP